MNCKELIEKIQNRCKEKAQIFEKSKKRIYVTLKKEEVREVAQFMFLELGARLSICSGVDTPANYEVLYHFSFDRSGMVVTVRALVPKEDPQIDSVADFAAGAAWIELEMNELLGIKFKGNPRTRRFLLADDWPEGVFPLRKSGEEKDG